MLNNAYNDTKSSITIRNSIVVVRFGYLADDDDGEITEFLLKNDTELRFHWNFNTIVSLGNNNNVFDTWMRL